MVSLCLLANLVSMYTRSCSATWAGQASEQPSSIVLVSGHIFFWHFVAFCCYVWHPRLPLFTSNLLTCCAMWMWSMRIQCAFNSLQMHIKSRLQWASCECTISQSSHIPPFWHTIMLHYLSILWKLFLHMSAKLPISFHPCCTELTTVSLC